MWVEFMPSDLQSPKLYTYQGKSRFKLLLFSGYVSKITHGKINNVIPKNNFIVQNLISSSNFLKCTHNENSTSYHKLNQ